MTLERSIVNESSLCRPALPHAGQPRHAAALLEAGSQRRCPFAVEMLPHATIDRTGGEIGAAAHPTQRCASHTERTDARCTATPQT
eukprot:363897-Chlamydomonas_euryale.AAC.3